MRLARRGGPQRPLHSSRTWDAAVPEADDSKERAEKIDKF